MVTLQASSVMNNQMNDRFANSSAIEFANDSLSPKKQEREPFGREDIPEHIEEEKVEGVEQSQGLLLDS